MDAHFDLLNRSVDSRLSEHISRKHIVLSRTSSPKRTWVARLLARHYTQSQTLKKISPRHPPFSDAGCDSSARDTSQVTALTKTRPSVSWRKRYNQVHAVDSEAQAHSEHTNSQPQRASKHQHEHDVYNLHLSDLQTSFLQSCPHTDAQTAQDEDECEDMNIQYNSLIINTSLSSHFDQMESCDAMQTRKLARSKSLSGLPVPTASTKLSSQPSRCEQLPGHKMRCTRTAWNISEQQHCMLPVRSSKDRPTDPQSQSNGTLRQLTPSDDGYSSSSRSSSSHSTVRSNAIFYLRQLSSKFQNELANIPNKTINVKYQVSLLFVFIVLYNLC